MIKRTHAEASNLPEQLIIFRVGTDPEPMDVGAIANPDHAIIKSDARGKNRPRRMHLPKAQAWVIRILREERVSAASLFFD